MTLVPSLLLLLLLWTASNEADAFTSSTPTTSFHRDWRRQRHGLAITKTTTTTTGLAASVGIYYGTVGGDTAQCARYIGEEVGVKPRAIDEVSVDEVVQKDCLIVGAPTWNTGATQERSMTPWDTWLYETLPSLDLSNTKVAVFGCGDQVHYAFGYCDAVGELYDCFVKQGCQPYGQTSTDGYQHTSSKAEIEEGGKFVGCLFDEDNQNDLSKVRAQAWVQQLKEEGFL